MKWQTTEHPVSRQGPRWEISVAHGVEHPVFSPSLCAAFGLLPLLWDFPKHVSEHVAALQMLVPFFIPVVFITVVYLNKGHFFFNLFETVGVEGEIGMSGLVHVFSPIYTIFR